MQVIRFVQKEDIFKYLFPLIVKAIPEEDGEVETQYQTALLIRANLVCSHLQEKFIWEGLVRNQICGQARRRRLPVGFEMNHVNPERSISRIPNFERNFHHLTVIDEWVLSPIRNIEPLSGHLLLEVGLSSEIFGLSSQMGSLFSYSAQCNQSRNGSSEPNQEQRPIRPSVWRYCIVVIPSVTLCETLVVCGLLLAASCGGVSWRRGWYRLPLGVLLVLTGILGSLLTLAWLWQTGQEEQQSDACFHGANTVSQKYLLTSTNYRNTLMSIERWPMGKAIETEKQVAIIAALAEGSGIRQIERITGVHRDTIMRLGVKVGQGCAALLDAKMRDLSCEHLQMDELWGFIGKKQRHVTPEDNPELGDVWTFCAIDSDTKLVPSFKVGKRDTATANAFVADLASRLKIRTQLSADALPAYIEAVEQAFGANVDFAQVIKVFESQSADAEVIRVDKMPRTGRPNLDLASTSHVERLNGTTRLHMRRLSRLTYAFSKKRENFEAAVALHFAYYNFVKRHNSLRMTPAMAAGIERDFWTVGDLVEAAA
jgi:IS1 family transposase